MFKSFIIEIICSVY